MRETADLGAGARQAVIDIGSNTVRLVIYAGSRRAPSVLWNEKVTARLGRDLGANGAMNEEAMDLALAGLRRYRLLLDQLGVRQVRVLATAAARDAANGPDFIEAVRAAGFEPEVLSGKGEARLSAAGVIGAYPSADGMVADLGGGSLELIAVDRGVAGDGTTLPLGTLRLAELRESSKSGLRPALLKRLKTVALPPSEGRDLFLVGGTWRALAQYVLHQQASPMDDPHGLTLPADEADRLAKKLARSKAENVATIGSISSMRAAKLPDAAVLLRLLIDQLAPAQLVISAWGLREGALFASLPELDKRQDPLLAGINAYAAPRGGTASLAARIGGWSTPATPAGSDIAERLRLAAIQLALATMATEPNLRLQHSTNLALHKRWIGIDFAERGMLAAALAANCGADVPEEATRLAEPDQLRTATAWGQAIRLFRRLGGNARGMLNSTILSREEDRLVLRFAESVAPLCNAGVEKDFARLANSLGLTPDIAFIADAEFAQLGID